MFQLLQAKSALLLVKNVRGFTFRLIWRGIGDIWRTVPRMEELSGMSEAVRELAMSRLRLIQPHLEEGRSLNLVAADAKLSFRTAQRWVGPVPEVRACSTVILLEQADRLHYE